MTVARKHRDFGALECLPFGKFRGLAITGESFLLTTAKITDSDLDN